MWQRRFSAWLCALCFGLSALSSVALAVDMPGIDDLGIDPWGDLEIIRPTPTVEPTPEQLPPAAPIQVPEPDAAGEGAGLFSLVPGGSQFYEFRVLGAFTLSSNNGNIAYFNNYFDQVMDYDVLSSPRGMKVGQLMGWSGNLYVKKSGSSVPCFAFLQSTDITVTELTELKYSGTLSCSFGYTAASVVDYTIQDPPATTVASSFYACPDYAYILINGSPVGDKLALTSTGDLVLQDFSVDLSSLVGQVISTVGIGYYFNDNKAISTLTYSGSGANYTAYYLYLKYKEADFTVESGEKVPPTPTPTPGMTDDERHEETKGFLESIISAIQGIFDAIVNLPGKIVSGLLDGLKSLFVPSEEDLEELKGKYETLLSERLGFIWQAGEWITGFGSDLLAAFGGTDVAQFEFPGVGFEMNGEQIQLIAAQEVDFQGNAIVQTLQPYVGTIVAFVVVIGCINVFSDMVTAVISGKSYADFLKGDGGG